MSSEKKKKKGRRMMPLIAITPLSRCGQRGKVRKGNGLTKHFPVRGGLGRAGKKQIRKGGESPSPNF